jgi:hypothetical protein
VDQRVLARTVAEMLQRGEHDGVGWFGHEQSYFYKRLMMSSSESP